MSTLDVAEITDYVSLTMTATSAKHPPSFYESTVGDTKQRLFLRVNPAFEALLVRAAEALFHGNISGLCSSAILEAGQEQVPFELPYKPVIESTVSNVTAVMNTFSDRMEALMEKRGTYRIRLDAFLSLQQAAEAISYEEKPPRTIFKLDVPHAEDTGRDRCHFFLSKRASALLAIRNEELGFKQADGLRDALFGFLTRHGLSEQGPSTIKFTHWPCDIPVARILTTTVMPLAMQIKKVGPKSDAKYRKAGERLYGLLKQAKPTP